MHENLFNGFNMVLVIDKIVYYLFAAVHPSPVDSTSERELRLPTDLGSIVGRFVVFAPKTAPLEALGVDRRHHHGLASHVAVLAVRFPDAGGRVGTLVSAGSSVPADHHRHFSGQTSRPAERRLVALRQRDAADVVLCVRRLGRLGRHLVSALDGADGPRALHT